MVNPSMLAARCIFILILIDRKSAENLKIKGIPPTEAANNEAPHSHFYSHFLNSEGENTRKIPDLLIRIEVGAGEGNRTLVSILVENCRT